MTAAPDLAEPVAGWRVWQVRDVDGGPEIVSPMRPVRWPARRTMSAVCHLGCPTVPASTCRCGLYALATPTGLPSGTSDGARIVGCTALWGRVIEYTGGYRAEHGYPLVLFVRSEIRATAVQVARRRMGLPDAEDTRAAPAGPLARELAAHYAVPVGVIPDRVERYVATDVQRARAVAREATRGLAERRAGDLTAHERLAGTAQDLFGGSEWYVPLA